MNAHAASVRPARHRGFTLVEILVAMALLSVVMLALGSALRSIAQTEERIDQRLERADEMRIAVAFVRSTLERVSARKVVPPPPAREGVLFEAGANSVSWVGVMPARHGAGGRCFFRLSVETTGSESALVIRFVPWADAAQFPDWSRAESRVLVRGVTRASFQFQDELASRPTWSPDWTARDRLPDKLLLEIDTDAGAWPPLAFPMRATPASNPSLGGAAFGAS